MSSNDILRLNTMKEYLYFFLSNISLSKNVTETILIEEFGDNISNIFNYLSNLTTFNLIDYAVFPLIKNIVTKDFLLSKHKVFYKQTYFILFCGFLSFFFLH